MYVLETSLRLMADYTLLLAAYAARISQQEQLPRWSASRFCLSLTHSLALLALRACYLAACRIVASLTHPLLLDRLKVALESSQTRSGRPVFKSSRSNILYILSQNFSLMALLIC